MSVQDLIQRLCPDGVPFKELGEVLDYEQPTKYLVASTEYDSSYPTPVLTAGQTFILGYTDETNGIYPASHEAPVMIFDDFTTAFKWVDFPFKAKSSAMKMLSVKSGVSANLRYVYYAMLGVKYTPQGHSRHWIGTYSKFRIPLPPMEVQEEIVRILDRFSALRDSLEEELDARKRQRLAYRSQLPWAARIQELSPEGSEQVAIGVIATKYVDPVAVRPDDVYVNLGVKWYGEGTFAREPKLGKEIKGTTLYRVKPGQFIYNRMFVTEGSFGLVTSDLAHGVVSNEFPAYDLDETRVLPEWLLLTFQDPNTVKAAARETSGGTKSRRRWKEEQFEAFIIDLPSLPAQREIVRVLNTFSQLESELKAEVAARQVQHEHYRDRLLTFKESAS